MPKEVTIWLAVFAVGAINYLSRLSFIAIFARRDMPPLLERALKHVPAAMLTAIVVPAVVFMPPGTLDVSPGNGKLVAAIVAGGVAWRWQNALLTIGTGMAVLWLLRYFVG